MDEPTDEALTIVPRRAIRGEPLTQIFDRLWFERRLSRVIQSDSSKEFCARAMLNWAHQRSVHLHQIQPPQSECLHRTFNGRLHDECLNEHRFVCLWHAKTIIEDWRQEYHLERLKKAERGANPRRLCPEIHRGKHRMITNQTLIQTAIQRGEMSAVANVGLAMLKIRSTTAADIAKPLSQLVHSCEEG